MFSPLANGRTFVPSAAGKPLGLMHSVVAACSSSYQNGRHSSVRPISGCSTPAVPPYFLNTARAPRTRRTVTHALSAPLSRPASTSSTSSPSNSNTNPESYSDSDSGLGSDSGSSAIAVTASSVMPSVANPPETTRPPSLTLPERSSDPNSSYFKYLLSTGKAYLSFYKTGLRYLYTNTKLVRAMEANNDTSEAVKAGHATRSDLLLRRRWVHDMRRLPLFGLMFIVCGEFTPFVVLLFPHVVPYTCRIPKQVDQLRHTAESRRQEAFKTYQETQGAAESSSAKDILVSRSLGLVAPFWDRIGLLGAGSARRAVEQRLAFLTEDDALLRQAGGVPALEPEEVLLAGADRGLDIADQGVDRVRAHLIQWLQLTRPRNNNSDDSAVHEQMLTLLTRRPEAWPLK